MKIITKIKKCVAIGLCLALLLLYSLPTGTFAQEETQEVTNETTLDASVATTANTGDNTIGDPTPTPEDATTLEESPTETQTETESTDPLLPTDDGSITATNSAELTNEATSSAITGENKITLVEEETPEIIESTQTHEEDSEQTTDTIDTGDAAAITTVENTVNTTEVNSQVVYQTINLFVDQNGDIDLSDPAALIELLTTQYPDESILNVALTQITNTASVENTIDSNANTGNNQIQTDGTGEIVTGDAYSLIAALNRINFVMIDSVLHIVTINIFGNFTGNILLPEYVNQGTEPCADCDTATAIDNDATVTNDIDSEAVSGQNTIRATGDAAITTGNAVSIIQLTNLLNTTLINAGLFQLMILPFGSWDGTFLGWESVPGQEGGGPLTIATVTGVGGTGCATCTGDVSIDNAANVTNTIHSAAVSGGNSIDGENGEIQTGQAISVVSLINLINTSLIRSSGFFGFINIFGSWTGNIGGASLFAQEEPVISVQGTSEASEEVRQSGGLLEVTNANNVGAYVMPGDTVTFFVNTKNPGTGRIYDVTLDLMLYQDGVNHGGAHFSLGDIDAGRVKKLSTGLVLSEETPPGAYTAVATVHGTTGPENTEVTAQATSQFTVFGSTIPTAVEELLENTPPTGAMPAILGTANERNTSNILFALLVLLLLVPTYRTVRVFENPNLLRIIFAPRKSWAFRLRATMTLLL
jgi:hypothetical protein